MQNFHSPNQLFAQINQFFERKLFSVDVFLEEVRDVLHKQFFLLPRGQVVGCRVSGVHETGSQQNFLAYFGGGRDQHLFVLSLGLARQIFNESVAHVVNYFTSGFYDLKVASTFGFLVFLAKIREFADLLDPEDGAVGGRGSESFGWSGSLDSADDFLFQINLRFFQQQAYLSFRSDQPNNFQCFFQYWFFSLQNALAFAPHVLQLISHPIHHHRHSDLGAVPLSLVADFLFRTIQHSHENIRIGARIVEKFPIGVSYKHIQIQSQLSEGDVGDGESKTTIHEAVVGAGERRSPDQRRTRLPLGVVESDVSDLWRVLRLGVHQNILRSVGNRQFSYSGVILVELVPRRPPSPGLPGPARIRAFAVKFETLQWRSEQNSGMRSDRFLYATGRIRILKQVQLCWHLQKAVISRRDEGDSVYSCHSRLQDLLSHLIDFILQTYLVLQTSSTSSRLTLCTWIDPERIIILQPSPDLDGNY